MDISTTSQTTMPTSSQLFALKKMDARNTDLRERNEARIKAFKESMGEKWVLHPANSPEKQVAQRVLR